MRVNKIDNTNFEAKFVSNAKIFRLKNAATYEPFYATLVRIEPSNQQDIAALSNIATNEWKDNKFANSVLCCARAIYNNSRYYIKNKVYALTKQTSDFDNLKSEDIIGIANIKPLNSSGHVFLEHIETNPVIRNNSKAEFKGVGSAILSAIKETCNKISLFALDDKKVKDFYLKNDFMEYPPHTGGFVWYKSIDNYF